MAGTTSKGPLRGVRVLCVNNYLAGNYGTMLLALHGADVVKVEPPAGEAMRSSRPLVEVEPGRTVSHFELRMMRGVGSVLLDLGSRTGRASFEDMLRAADVFWTNLRPESAVRRELDWATLRQVNPQLVYTSLSGFGLPENGTGEFTGLPAFDILIQGAAGLLARNASGDGTPTYNGLPLADQIASLYAAFGVLLGLRQRDLTGEGCCVDVAMFDAMVALNEKAVSMFGVQGEIPPPRASATTAPFGLYRAMDGWVCIAVGSDAVWRRFCSVVGPAIGRPNLVADDRFAAGTGRVALLAEVEQIVDAFVRERSVDEIVDALLAHDVPAGRSAEVDTIVPGKQVKARAIIRPYPVLSGTIPVVMSPVQISGADQVVSPPPQLGADADQIAARWQH
jgi:CoA:oxalate CoA-transferase